MSRWFVGSSKMRKFTSDFISMHAIPGGPFNSEKAVSPATIAALNARYGLDKPVFDQFLAYIREILHGDFGVSLKSGRDITAIIGETFPISAKIGLIAMADTGSGCAHVS